jgi:hypothetical protein
VDRGFDPDAADPFGGLTAHADHGDAPEHRPAASPDDHPTQDGDAARARPWSRHAMGALLTAWTAIACSYRSHASISDAAVRGGTAEW